MADIDLKCSSCSTVVTVSEFADPSLLKCPKCGAKLSKPETESLPRPRPTVALRQTLTDKPIAQQSEDAEAKEWRFHTHMMKKRQNTSEGPSLHVHTALSWLLFLVVGGALGYLRYGSSLQPQHLALLKQFSPVVIGVTYVIIILSSFKYSVYQGILSLVIPLYPFFYLFTVSDNLYLRAIVAGLIVGFGYDSGLFVNKWAAIIYYEVTQWIARGGT